MFTYRGRGGPSRSTPASVQCQKCLKRGHYSYECQSSAQERPYVPRPSRTQQLRNPKLKPKLTEDTLVPLEKKKGVADEELAKREKERERKRQLEDRDEDHLGASNRRRSVSSESVMSISTNASKSPARQRSPPRRDLNVDAAGEKGTRGRRNIDSRSPSLPPKGRRSYSRDSRSPSPYPKERTYRSRQSPNPARRGDERRSAHRRSSSSESREGTEPYERGQGDSRRRGAKGHNLPRARYRDKRNVRDHGGRRDPPPCEHARDRSLSPFSKRLALTQSLEQ